MGKSRRRKHRTTRGPKRVKKRGGSSGDTVPRDRRGYRKGTRGLKNKRCTVEGCGGGPYGSAQKKCTKCWTPFKVGSNTIEGGKRIARGEWDSVVERSHSRARPQEAPAAAAEIWSGAGGPPDPRARYSHVPKSGMTARVGVARHRGKGQITKGPRRESSGEGRDPFSSSPFSVADFSESEELEVLKAERKKQLKSDARHRGIAERHQGPSSLPPEGIGFGDDCGPSMAPPPEVGGAGAQIPHEIDDILAMGRVQGVEGMDSDVDQLYAGRWRDRQCPSTPMKDPT